MPSLKALPIVLSAEQHELLDRIVRCHTSEQRLVRRAQIVLKANEGLSNKQIAQSLSINRETVQRWRQRWDDGGEVLRVEEEKKMSPKALKHRIDSILTDRPRPGTPPTFSAEQVVRIVALACEDPQKSGRPVTEWTPQELAEEASKRGIVESISARSIERFLK
jgi:putative transposase